jgi:hypothetical protein
VIEERGAEMHTLIETNAVLRALAVHHGILVIGGTLGVVAIDLNAAF